RHTRFSRDWSSDVCSSDLEFSFTANVPFGEQMLRIEKFGYTTKRYPIVVNQGQIVDISGMTLDFDNSDSVDQFTITLSDDELNRSEERRVGKEFRLQRYV